MASERLCTAWNDVEISLALGTPMLSVAGDEGIEKRKAWKRLNNSAQVEPSPDSIRYICKTPSLENIRSSIDSELDMKLHPTATEIILSHVTRCSGTKWTSKDSSKEEELQNQGSSSKFIYDKQQQYIFVIQGLPSDLFIVFENQPGEAYEYTKVTSFLRPANVAGLSLIYTSLTLLVTEAQWIFSFC